MLLSIATSNSRTSPLIFWQEIFIAPKRQSWGGQYGCEQWCQAPQPLCLANVRSLSPRFSPSHPCGTSIPPASPNQAKTLAICDGLGTIEITGNCWKVTLLSVRRVQYSDNTNPIKSYSFAGRINLAFWSWVSLLVLFRFSQSNVAAFHSLFRLCRRVGSKYVKTEAHWDTDSNNVAMNSNGCRNWLVLQPSTGMGETFWPPSASKNLWWSTEYGDQGHSFGGFLEALHS